MLNKKNRYIFFMIVLFVFISEIHVNDMNLESVFTCLATESETSCFIDDITIKISAGDSAEKVLSICGNMKTGQFVVQMSGQRRDMKESLYFVYQKLLFCDEENSYIAQDMIKEMSDGRNAIIVKYINKSDGKKRI